MIKRLKKYSKIFNTENNIIFIFLLMLVVLFILLNVSGLTERLELLFYDLKVTVSANNNKHLKHDSNIVIVVADKWSFNNVNNFDLEFDRWPWPRDVLAETINYINESGARAILFNIIIEVEQNTEKDTKLINAISNVEHFYSITKIGGFKADTLNNLDRTLSNLNNFSDKAFKKRFNINKDNYVSVYEYSGKKYAIRELYKSLIKNYSQQQIPEKFALNVKLNGLSSDSSIIDNISFLAHSNIPKSFINAFKIICGSYMSRDIDGALREDIPIFKDVKQNLYIPSVAFAAFIDLYGNGEAEITNKFIKVKDLKIPINNKGRIKINFNSKNFKYKEVSLLKVLLSSRIQKNLIQSDNKLNRNIINPDTFKNKIVIISSERSSPSDKIIDNISGAKFYSSKFNYLIANTIDNYFICAKGEDKFIKTLPAYLVIIIIIIFCSGNCFLICKCENIFIKFGMIFAGILLYLLLSMFLYVNTSLRYDLPVIVPVYLIFFTSLTSFLWQYKCVYNKQKEVDKLFGKFVSPQIKKALLEDPTLINYEGQKKEMTVLFTDLRNFTSISEKTPARQTIAQLNEYFSAMVDIIINEFDGTLDKFIGDAIMAFWNDPIPQDNHAELAVKAAIKMQQKLSELNKIWLDRGWNDLQMGIGINTGEMTVGHMGGETFLDYTVIGDNVNTASRLESLTKEFSANIIISETVYKSSKHFINAEYLGEHTIKGKEIPVKIYKIIDYNMLT
ncbi:MAG: adenylate/guanylate cyclase domain-containing protein [Cyanobacteriota bacterium]